jgi:hypothetical protein
VKGTVASGLDQAPRGWQSRGWGSTDEGSVVTRGRDEGTSGGSRGGMNVATTSGLGGGTNVRNGWDKEKREYIW